MPPPTLGTQASESSTVHVAVTQTREKEEQEEVAVVPRGKQTLTFHWPVSSYLVGRGRVETGALADPAHLLPARGGGGLAARRRARQVQHLVD